MPLNPKLGDLLSDLFLEQPCWMIGPLAIELHYSISSVRRFLSNVGYYRSFTHNGGWYTLRSIPHFNDDGLWFYKDIGFSRKESLTNTLVDLTTRSTTGMTAEQLGTKLRCRCHSVLLQLCRQGRLQRKKLGSSHIYLAADPDIATVQCQSVENQSVVQFPAEIAVLIFVEFIRNPDSSFDDLAEVISRKASITVKATQIERLFNQHGLKKKTRTVGPRP